MKLRIRSAGWLAVAGWLLLAGGAAARNGVIPDQQLNGSGQGYTALRVWGSHYEMGYVQANLLELQGYQITMGASRTPTPPRATAAS